MRTAIAENWEEAIEIIREEPLEKLEDNLYLEKTLLPRMGLNNEKLHEFPLDILQDSYGKGLKSWQYPIQFSGYLRWLAQQDIDSYLEIGCRHGGTFIATVEYLRRFGRLSSIACVDVEESPILRGYAKKADFEYRVESSQSEGFRQFAGSRFWGNVLIDGDHSWEGVSADYAMIKDHTRIVTLHDIVSQICPGVISMWQIIKTVLPANRVHEWTVQYSEVYNRTKETFLGIGAAVLAEKPV